MPRVKIEWDQRPFLKPHSDIENALKRHGRRDARDVADRFSGPDPIFFDVHDIADGKGLAQSLNQIAGVKATVES